MYFSVLKKIHLVPLEVLELLPPEVVSVFPGYPEKKNQLRFSTMIEGLNNTATVVTANL